MAKILAKYVLAPKTHYLRIEAPLVAKHAKAGQFVVVRLSETGERVPFTIADIDPQEGTITLVIQELGKTTQQIAELKTGDEVRDVLGPLGMPSEVEDFGTVVLIGGGFGIAAIHLLAKALRARQNQIVSIIGARNKGLLIMEEEMRRVSHELFITSDDGSVGNKGLVIEPLKALLDAGRKIDRVVAVGPIPMMRAVGEVTRPFGIKTIVSLNPIMVDGTGMCGGCRVSIGNETKFACVDGPEFDAHLVDFDELNSRNRMYHEHQQIATNGCRLEGQIKSDMAGSVKQ
jgi:ferredoxin--NADP+ reductase